MNNKLFLLLGLIFTILFSSKVFANTWSPTSSVIAGLPNCSSGVSSYSCYGDIKFGIAGSGAQTLMRGGNGCTNQVWLWNGTQWVENSTYEVGLSGWSGRGTCTVFYNLTGDSKWVSMCGNNDGTFYSQEWNDTSWVENSTFINGLPDIGWVSSPFVIYGLFNESNWKLIAGNNDNGFFGFQWNGTSWEENSTIVNNVQNAGGGAKPRPFYYNGEWRMITGHYNADYKGWVWNGTAWAQDAEMISGLHSDSNFKDAVVCDNCTGTGSLEAMTASDSGHWFGYSVRTISDCSALTQSGSTYFITKDIYESFGSPCISIQANNVTLDCQNHLINQTDGFNRAITDDGYGNVSIKNCNVGTFMNGIYVDFANNVDLNNNTITSNSQDGITVVSSTNVVVDGVSCYNIGNGGSCIKIENLTGVSIRNIYENKIDNSNGYGVNFCDGCGTNTTNAIVRNVTFNGTWVRTTNNKDSMAVRMTDCVNCTINDVHTTNTRHSALMRNVDGGDMWDIHANNCQYAMVVGDSSTNIKIHDSNDFVDCRPTWFEVLSNSEIYNIDSSNDSRGAIWAPEMHDTYMHDNNFNVTSMFEGAIGSQGGNLTLRNNTFGIIIWGFADVYGYDLQNYNNDIDTSNYALGLPLYYFFNRSTDVTGLNTHNIMCMGCSNIEIKNMDLGDFSSLTLTSSNNLTLRNMTVGGHSPIVDANVTIIKSTWKWNGTFNGIGIDTYWDYAEPFEYLTIIDSVFGMNYADMALINTNVTAINTTLTSGVMYGDSNSFVSRYWYLAFSISGGYNPFNPHVIIRDSKNNTLFDGDSRNASLTALEYVSTCLSPDCDNTTETRDYYTNYTINVSSSSYNKPFAGIFDFSENNNFFINLESKMTSTGNLLSDVGSGVGSFLSAITLGVTQIIIYIAIIMGVLSIFYAIAYVFKKFTGGNE